MPDDAKRNRNVSLTPLMRIVSYFGYVQDDIKYVYGFSATQQEIIDEYLRCWPKGREKVIFSRQKQSFSFPKDNEQKRKKLISEAVGPNQLFFAEEKMEYQDQRYSAPYVQDFGVGHFEAGAADSGDVTVRTLRGCLERLKIFHFNDTSISSRIRSSTNTADGGYLRADGGNLAGFLHRLKKNEAEYAYYQRIVRYIRMILPQFYDFALEPDENGYISLNWVQNGAEEVFGPHQLSDGALRFTIRFVCA